MSLEDLTKKDWDALENKLVTQVTGWCQGDQQHLNNIRSDFFKKYRLWQKPGIQRGTYLFYTINNAIQKPFKDIPSVLSNSTEVEKAVYSFRFEKGI